MTYAIPECRSSLHLFTMWERTFKSLRYDIFQSTEIPLSRKCCNILFWELWVLMAKRFSEHLLAIFKCSTIGLDVHQCLQIFFEKYNCMNCF